MEQFSKYLLPGYVHILLLWVRQTPFLVLNSLQSHQAVLLLQVTEPSRLWLRVCSGSACGAAALQMWCLGQLPRRHLGVGGTAAPPSRPTRSGVKGPVITARGTTLSICSFLLFLKQNPPWLTEAVWSRSQLWRWFQHHLPGSLGGCAVAS